MNKEASIQSHQAKKTRLGLVILILLIINYGVVSLSLLASTQFTAHQLNYSDDLGQPLYGRIYNPSHYFTWLSQNHTLTNDAAIRSISLGIFIAPSALCLLISISIFLKVLKKRKLMHANNDHPPPAASYESAPPQHVPPDPTPIIEIAEEPDSPFITENTAGTDALPLSEQDSEALTLADIPGVIAVTRFDQEGSVVAHQQHEPARTPENLEQLTTKFIENTRLKGRYLELGAFTQCVMEYNEGKIVIASEKNAGMMIVIHNKTDIGSIRHVIKQEIQQFSLG